MERKKIAKSFWIKLVSVPVLMFFFAYAMVPIYDVLCDLTGFNGKTGTVETEQEYLVDEERLVSVSFFAATSLGFQFSFA
jgi:cytochrome c oxidase assembly protein subunit 11